MQGEIGACGVGRLAIVASAHPHFGEERPLVGRHGSGTVFLSGCNLKCIFCQNHDISHGLSGKEVTAGQLASMMLGLQTAGCHNLNLVSPTHVVPQILEAVSEAARDGFRLPIVYNTGGYDSMEVIGLLDGIVDIYMPDIKYLSRRAAGAYSGAEDYPDVIRAVLREMHRQVGDLEVSADGVAARGLLVRHLVMPGLLDDTRRIVEFIAGDISKNTYLNVMRQYHPAHEARTHPPLDRPITAGEWAQAVEMAEDAGLHRLDRAL